jgi:tetratricopeptide (TPR) repeat protein
MNKIHLGCTLASFLALAAPAAHASNYGAFLASQFATSQGRMDIAARGMLTALDADPSSSELQKDAFGLAFLAGLPDAVRLAASVPNEPTAQLLLADTKARNGDWQAAELAYAELPHTGVIDALRPLLLAWAQQAQGRIDRALETLQTAAATGHLANFYLLHAALIADVDHRDGLAGRLYTQVEKDMGEPNLRLAQILASWQARSGRPDQARHTIEAVVNNTPELSIAKSAMLADIDHPQIADAAQGIAEAYASMAGALRQQDSGDLPPLLLQLALNMQPDLTEARLIGAELAAAVHDDRRAADQLKQVAPGDPLAAVAALHLAAFEGRLGDTSKAEAVLEKLAADYPDQAQPLTELGDIFADAKNYPDAVAAYDRAIARLPHPQKQDWILFYARGIAQERVHDWPRAEADMKQALALAPDQPFVLNFLGFSWTEQNRNLDEAKQMIQQALAQRPNDGAIVDSLGWVLLRQGDVHDAVHTLEKAAELEPVDPSITGHLGDAYWQAGRHIEAEDQWRRALVLKPDPDEAARIETRLKSASAAKP